MGAPLVRFLLVAVSLTVVPIAAIDARGGSRGSRSPAVTAPTVETTADAAVRADAIDANVLQLGLGAASCAVRAGAVADPSTLSIIDYTKPSTEKRLWVFDLHSGELLYHELVAHGQGSGENFATQFSNEQDTHRSSLGLFITEDTYVGKNGYSLRLHGLDVGFNDRARERAIVVHGAAYVSEDFMQTQGRLGRSWGCPALSDDIAARVIDRVKGGSLVFAYYPDREWLQTSKFLGDCSSVHTFSVALIQ
jgi:hypothetical protein